MKMINPAGNSARTSVFAILFALLICGLIGTIWLSGRKLPVAKTSTFRPYVPPTEDTLADPSREFAPDPHTLLLLHFNQLISPAGKAQYVRWRGHVELTRNNAGYAGEAMLIQPDMCVSPEGISLPFHPLIFDIRKFPCAERGTLEFRFFLYNLAPPAGTNLSILNLPLAALACWQGGSALRCAKVGLTFPGGKAALELWENHHGGRAYYCLRSEPQDNLAGQWHHFALVWEGKTRAIFLDGKLIARGERLFNDPPKGKTPADLAEEDEQFVSGARDVYIGESVQPPFKPQHVCLLDEFRLSDIVRYPLSPAGQ